MEACGQDTHMTTREGTDLNPSDTVYPGDKPPPGVRLTWISNNLPLKHINDTRRPGRSRRVGTDGEAIER